MKYLKTNEELNDALITESLKSFLSSCTKDDIINYLKNIIKKYNYKLLLIVIPIILSMNLLTETDILNISSHDKSTYNKVLGVIKDTRPDSEQYLDSIAQSESSNKANIVNSLGYIGKYQFHDLALIDAGVVKNKSEASKFRKKFINLSKADRLKYWTEEDQDQAMINLMNKNKYYLRNYDEYIGDTINGIVIDWSGLLGAAHLGGQKNVKKFLSSNGKTDFADGNGVKVSIYMKKFSGYNINSIIENN
jgi:hypothetical protein